VILLSVGTQFPFDRLVTAVDAWAVANARDDVVAQIGPSTYKPKALKCFPFSQPDAFRALQAEATVMIAHAGMGSILTALEFGKPIVIRPRDHLRGEHRNAHQIATAKRFADMPGVYVVEDEAALADRLHRLDELVAAQRTSGKAPDSFVSQLRTFIEEDVEERGWRRLLRPS
jgi:UDP-N-acetylglucosamine transferase subunit ALG13